ncbi:RkpR, polysaccharide export protein [Ciceribacter sp. RN22]|uniref:RkpR, polysaccharide export protein n=1 Tax=Ciceribacter sp. RN22 TaxID=2954932 RepID=UPI002093659E|nr:RkpR, polysaccharide export protein [Ciceribacter sp. RN22]MCO6179020.1 RkpR, polysaccharide export protein [Ciceribacter sp. RN22]
MNVTELAPNKKTGDVNANLRVVSPERASPKSKKPSLPERFLKVYSKADPLVRIDEIAPGATKRKLVSGKLGKLRLRHLIIGGSFVAIVAVPAMLAFLYMAFIAADQYHSSSSFSVRSMNSAQPADILGMFAQTSSGSTVSDSYVLLDFISSERMAQMVDETFGLETIFAPRGLDYYYGLHAGLPIEDKVRYWRDMVSVNFDLTSGIINLEVRSFTPEDSQNISAFVISQSEKLINDLSLSARDEVLSVAQDEVRTAEGRLAKAREAVRMYRDISQEANPVEGAKLAMELVAALEKQLVVLKTELSTALSQMDGDTPRIRLMRSQIASLEQQIEQEKARFGSGTSTKQARNGTGSVSDVAGRIEQYETLETDREFAERAYTAALAGLEKARLEASAKQRYLAVFIQPTLSEWAQYPSRLTNSLLVLLGALLVWSVIVMGYYNIRDRN